MKNEDEAPREVGSYCESGQESRDNQNEPEGGNENATWLRGENMMVI